MAEGVLKMDTAQATYNSRFRMQATGMIAMLAVQYILGMVNNLFVKFPDTTRPGLLWEFARSQAWIMVHMILGALLLINATVILVLAFRRNHPVWKSYSIAGLAGIALAFLSGIGFVTTQADPYSLLMALGFLLALVVYGAGLYAGKG